MDTLKANNRVGYLPKEAKDVLVSVNPNAGARSGQEVIEKTVRAIRERGYRVEVPTDIDQLAKMVTAKLQDGSLRAVVAAGGDGTVSLAVNRTPPGVPVIVLPLGTENLLAKHLNMTADPERICQILERGAYVHLDAGQANGHIFLLMLGCGFDAEVVRRLDQQRSGHIHHLSYVKPIFQSIRSYKYPELRITAESAEGPAGEESQVEAKWAFVVNLPRYAMGLGIAPGADGTDGKLDVCTFKRGSLWKGLMYLTGVIVGRHEKWDDCVTLRARKIRIESDAQVPYQVDGDPGGYLPLNIEALPQRLTLLVPEDWNGGTKE